MTTRVERIGDQYSVQFLLTEQELDALSLRANDPLDVQVVDGVVQIRKADDALEHASTEDALAAYRKTEARYGSVYQELAK